MGEGIGFVILTLLTGGSLIALFLGLRLLFPRIVEYTRLSADNMPGRAFAVGLVNFLFFGAVALGFIAISEGLGANIFLFPTLLILIALSVGLSLGLTGMVCLIGERLMPEMNLRQQMLWGGIVLTLASLTPFIGWFVFFPYAGLVGLGGFIIGWFRRSRGAGPEEAPEI